MREFPVLPFRSRTRADRHMDRELARRDRRQARHRIRAEGIARYRLRRVGVFLGACVLLAVPVGVLGLNRAATPPPVALVHMHLADARMMPPGDPVIPWPSTGQSAVAIPALDFEEESGPEHAVPVASMTKVMTAYVILHDHPLQLGQPGPTITITPAEAADYGTDIDQDQSSIQIVAGEVLTESQLVEGMLVHSANDFAHTLALWDAGSLTAFVAKMNATAASLGMTQSHFVDASGFTPGSVSTPGDLLKVTSLDIENPVFAQDVAQTSVTEPVGGTFESYTPLLQGGPTGVPGVVGVKSGYTTQAGGGDILAYQSSVDGQPFVVLAAVSSQQGPNILESSGEMDLGIAQAAAAHVIDVPVVAPNEVVGSASIPGKSSPVVTTASGSLLTWPGQHVTQTVVINHRILAGAPAWTLVGTALYSLGRQQIAVPLRTTTKLPAPTLSQRLF